jgi:hypothetical protein
LVSGLAAQPSNEGSQAIIDAMRAADRKYSSPNQQDQSCSATKGRPEDGFLKRNGLWSALQTRLQGVDGATLAMVPEKYVHCAALLSR